MTVRNFLLKYLCGYSVKNYELLGVWLPLFEKTNKSDYLVEPGIHGGMLLN